MNAKRPVREQADSWCFVSPGVRLQHPKRLSHKAAKCGPTMKFSLRKLTLAVALSLTVSSHRASMAAPALAASSVVQKEGLVSTSTPDTGGAGSDVSKPKGLGIVKRLRSRGISDEVAVMLVSSLPIVELRGGIPLGHYLGVPPFKTFLLAIIGNLLPLIPTMLLLRIRLIRTIASRFLERARKAADQVSNSRSRVVGLALFVGIPLPGTGAWTGCLIAFLLGMPMGVAMGSLSAGVVTAAVIVSALCVLGWIGAALAGCLLIGGGAASLWRMNEITGRETADMQDGDEKPIG